MAFMLKDFFLVIVFVLIIGGILTFIFADNAKEYRYFGPIIFNFHAFTYLGLLMGFSGLLALFYNYKNMQLGFGIFLLSTSFLLKITIIYFVFDGHVNYDTPLHYLSALYLKNYGINSTIFSYHNWPLALIFIDELSMVTNSMYPLDTSLAAITSRYILFLTLYLLSFKLFNDRKLIYLTLIVLLIFEPFILHFSPQIFAVAIYTLLVYSIAVKVVSNSQNRAPISNIVVILILYTSLLMSHVIFPVSLALIIASYYLTCKISLKFSIYNRCNSNSLLYVLIFVLLGVLSYNTLITIFVTKNVLNIIKAMFAEEENLRLDVYGPSIQSPDMVWQYSMLRIISRIAVITLLLIPTLYMFYHIFYVIYIKGNKNDKKYDAFLAFVIGINAFLYLVSFIIQMGLMERLLQLAIIFASISLPLSIQESLTLSKMRKALNGIFLYLILFLILSIYVAPAYQQIHWFFDNGEVFMAKWIANNISDNIIYLDGTDRLNQLIVLYAYPNRLYKFNLFITFYTDESVVKNIDSYPQGTIITITGLAYIKNSFKYSLSDVILKQYYDKLKHKIDMVYFDGINTCLIR